VTVCTKDREHLLGEIVEGKMNTNPAGEMVQKIWLSIPENYHGFKTDHYVVMPNHFHGIIIKENVGAGPCTCPDHKNIRFRATTGSRPYNLSLFDVMERFKSLTTKKYLEGIDINGWQPFNGKLWQRNYYEHIIRNGHELKAYRKYIKENTKRWDKDEYFDDEKNDP